MQVFQFCVHQKELMNFHTEVQWDLLHNRFTHELANDLFQMLQKIAKSDVGDLSAGGKTNMEMHRKQVNQDTNAAKTQRQNTGKYFSKAPEDGSLRLLWRTQMMQCQ